MLESSANGSPTFLISVCELSCSDAREEVPVQLSRLADAHQIIVSLVRVVVRLASKLGDDGTNDLLVSQVLRTNELQMWFLSEHLVTMPLTEAVK